MGELANQYQVVAVDDGTGNQRAGEILRARSEWNDETLVRWQGLMERMERLGWLQHDE